MIPPAAEQSIIEAAEILRSAKHAVVLTGAGISTPSGIPDFRSNKTGLWEQDDPMRVASLSAFRYHPEVFFNWLRPLAKKIWLAEPNLAHLGLAQMEKAGLLKATITQNIDGMHQAAGARSVLELHGSARTATCLSCHKTYPSELFRQSFLDGQVPHCQKCGAILKPDIVLFEELLPAEVWEEASEHCEQADAILVVGSSLEVTPASGLPYSAVANGARLIINTISRTYLDDRAEVLLPYDVVEVIPLILKAAIG
jgi:NAD-dependent deacetylase